MATNFVTLNQQNEPPQLTCQGAWTLANIIQIKNNLKQISLTNIPKLTIDGKAINKMDTSGAWELQKLFDYLTQQNINFTLQNFTQDQLLLLMMIASQTSQLKEIPRPTHFSWLHRLGQRAADQLILINAFLAFIGEISLVALRLLRRPLAIRWKSLLSIIEITGYQALPIIALLSFMIGVVLTYQMGLQLRTYGANIF